MFGAAGIQSLQPPRRAGRGDENRIRKDIVDTFEECAVGHERFANVVEDVPPRIDESFAENFQPVRGRSITPNAAAVQVTCAVRCLHVAVNVNRLVEVQTTIGSKTQRVDQVMRVLGAKPAQHDPPLVRPSIAIAVFQVEQSRAFGDVRGMRTIGNDTRGNQQSIGKHRAAVGDSVTVGISQHNDLVVGFLTRLDLRVDLAAGDPQSARPNQSSSGSAC